MNDKRGDKHRSGQGKDALPQRLVTGTAEEHCRADADQNRQPDAPMNRRHEPIASGLAQIGQRDRNDEEGFEPLAKGDGERR
jgi:hypothetical protein